MNRKGSLELSIQSIVIVVIAFVVLGLGLGFVRKQFAEIGSTTETIQEQIRQQILDDLRTGDKKLSFPTAEVTMGKKESKLIAIGVKNVNQGDLQYSIRIEPKGGAEGTDIFGGQSTDDISDNFLYIQDVEELGPTDTRVIPIRITSETSSGTGQFKLIIQDVTTGTPIIYDSKTFFITVTG